MSNTYGAQFDINSSNFYNGNREHISHSGPTPGATEKITVRVINTNSFSWNTSGAWYSYHKDPNNRINTYLSPSSGTCSSGDNIDIYFNVN